MASFWNKAVQESKLFMSDMFVEKDLIKNSREQVVTDLENAANKRFKTNYDGIAKAGGDELSNFKARTKDFDSTMLDVASGKNGNGNNASPWKDLDTKNTASLYRTAGKNAILQGHMPNSNADLDLEQYSSAVDAVRRRARIGAIGNTTKNYYMNPIKDGRYGAAAARIGATAAGVGTVGAITYSLTNGGAPDYSANYATPPSSDESQDY